MQAMADDALDLEPGPAAIAIEPNEESDELLIEPAVEPPVVLSPAPEVGISSSSTSMGADPSSQRRALCKAALGESWTATCGHSVSLADLSNSCLQRFCKHQRPSPTNMPNCQPCREQNGRQRPVVSLTPTAATEPAPMRVPVSLRPKLPQRVPPRHLRFCSALLPRRWDALLQWRSQGSSL